MPESASRDVLRLLQGACALQGTTNLSDHELLERFLANRDEGAFTFLVRRHGPVVFSVCQRLLGDRHNAEDALQAAFLVLVRRSDSIKRKESVGSWLYGVARNIALKARARDAARRKRDRTAVNVRAEREADPLATEELRSVLDEAIGTLAEKYRGPIMLCYLERKSYEQAARELGCPKSSLESRLRKALELLRRTLDRRGITLGVGALATALAETAKAAPLPAALTIKTVKAAALVAAEKAVVCGSISAHILALAEEAVRRMLWVKAKIVLVVIGFGLAAGAAGWVGYTAVVETGQTEPLEANAQSQAPKNQIEAMPKEPERTRKDVYGDPLPTEAIARLGTTRLRHGASPRALAFAPDGQSLASAGIDAVVHIWETATGKEILRIENDKFQHSALGAVFSLSYAPDGKTLAGARINQPVCMWNVETGKEIRQFGEDRYRARWVVFSPDGKTLAHGGTKDDPIRLTEVSTGDHHLFGSHKGFVSKAAFSLDGTIIASADDEGICLFDTTTGRSRELYRDDDKRMSFHSLAFSPDGKTLVGAIANGRAILFLGVATGKVVRKIELGGTIGELGSIVVAPDGKTLISSHDDGFVRFWDIGSGNTIRQFRAHVDPVIALALSRDGKTLATSANSGNNDNAVRLWETDTGKPIARYPGPQQGIQHVVFSSDNRRVATSSGEDAGQLWEVAGGKLLQQWDESGPLAFLPDNNTLICGGWRTGQVRFIDLASGKDIRKVQAHQIGISAISLTRDGKTLATGGYDQFVRLWDVGTGSQIHDFGGKQKDFLESLSFSPDGKLFASTHPSGSKVDTVRLWETASGKLLREEHVPMHVGNVRFSPDGKMFAYAYGVGLTPKIRLCDVATGKEIYQFDGQGGTMNSLDFSPDGRTLICNGFYPKDLYFWEVATGQLRRTFRAGHMGHVTRVAVSPDGRMLATGGSDACALVWDITGKHDRQKPSPQLSAAQMNALWQDLADADAVVAYQAMCALKASSVQCVQMIEKQIKPVPRVDAVRLAEAARKLDNSEFTIRKEGMKELENLGEAAESHLREILTANPSLEMRQRVEQLLNRLGGPYKLQQGRAFEVLEQIGDTASRRLLTTLAAGSPKARLTQEAIASLQRLDLRSTTVP